MHLVDCVNIQFQHISLASFDNSNVRFTALIHLRQAYTQQHDTAQLLQLLELLKHNTIVYQHHFHKCK